LVFSGLLLVDGDNPGVPDGAAIERVLDRMRQTGAQVDLLAPTGEQAQ